MTTLRARYPHGNGSVRRARRFIISVAARCGFDAETLSDIESATGEGLANAIEHGDFATQEGFAVCVSFDRAWFAVDIKDFGAGFDTGTVTATCPDPPNGRGYGIFLMHALMDEVAYSESGTRIRLVKRRSPDAGMRWLV